MPMNVKRPLAVLVLLGLGAWSAPSLADEANDLLARMRTAVHTLSYKGTLVYAQGSDLSTYQIDHSVLNGEEKEVVAQLSQGDGRASGEVERFSLIRSRQVQPQAEPAYSFDVGGTDRAAARECQIVIARPHDRMRYLQRYCIDPVSGMLLKYSLMDSSHQPIEQLMFTSLDIQPAVAQAAGNSPQPPDAAAKSVGALPVSTLVAAVPPAAKGEETKDDEAREDNDDAWKFDKLPAGFQQTKNLVQGGKDGKAPVRQIILSDGMTSISVFIPQGGGTGLSDAGEYSSGAMNIFTKQVDQHTVTLVGEVPVTTLESISESLKYVH